MDWQNIFLSPNGRIGQKEFWIGWVILFAVGLLLNALPEDIKWISGIVSLVLIYPTVCVWSKRLHDANRSGWLASLNYVALILFIVVAFVAGGAALISALSGQGDPGAALAGAGVFLLVFLAYVIFSIGFLLWVGLAKSDPETNKYGPPTDGSAATNF